MQKLYFANMTLYLMYMKPYKICIEAGLIDHGNRGVDDTHKDQRSWFGLNSKAASCTRSIWEPKLKINL